MERCAFVRSTRVFTIYIVAFATRRYDKKIGERQYAEPPMEKEPKRRQIHRHGKKNEMK